MSLLIDRIGKFLATEQEGYQAANFRRHLLASAFVLSAKNGVGTQDSKRYAESNIRTLLWGMIGVDFNAVNPTSKTHRSGWNFVAFAFGLADRIANDHGAASEFLLDTLTKAETKEDMAAAMVTLLKDKHPAGTFVSVDGITQFLKDRVPPVSRAAKAEPAAKADTAPVSAPTLEVTDTTLSPQDRIIAELATLDHKAVAAIMAACEAILLAPAAPQAKAA